MINNTVSRTCVRVRSLDGGQRITDLSTVSVTIRPRRDIPFGCCEPGPAPDASCSITAPASVDTWVSYPAHDFTPDKERICFHWDNKLWSKPAGRYMASVYLCGVCIGCFQMQVGKHFDVDTPTNISFNSCDADVAICTTDVTLCK
jgi:hypothetical protein